MPQISVSWVRLNIIHPQFQWTITVFLVKIAKKMRVDPIFSHIFLDSGVKHIGGKRSLAPCQEWYHSGLPHLILSPAGCVRSEVRHKMYQNVQFPKININHQPACHWTPFFGRWIYVTLNIWEPSRTRGHLQQTSINHEPAKETPPWSGLRLCAGPAMTCSHLQKGPVFVTS